LSIYGKFHAELYRVFGIKRGVMETKLSLTFAQPAIMKQTIYAAHAVAADKVKTFVQALNSLNTEFFRTSV